MKYLVRNSLLTFHYFQVLLWLLTDIEALFCFWFYGEECNFFWLGTMKCFTFSSGDKKDEPKSPKSISARSTNSASIEGEVKRFWPESNSQNASDTSTESLRRTSFPSLSQKPSNLRVFTVSELKSATKNFTRSAMIGEGRFGFVYKGLIKSAEDSSGKIEVAVKQLGRRGLQARLIPHAF